MKHWSEETNWQRLSDVLDRLTAQVNDAIARRDDVNGEAAHDDLVAAEWRLRQAERRRLKDG